MNVFRLKDVSFCVFSSGTLVVSDTAHTCGCCGRAAYVFVCANEEAGSHCISCPPKSVSAPVLQGSAA